MKIIEAYSAGEALNRGMVLLKQFGQRRKSRGGDVVVAPWPVVTINRAPLNRVLFSVTRDANPFFHLVEAAWMLAGRNSADDLIPYVKRFSEFMEDDHTVHGAYGHRWRSHYGMDQLQAVIDKLRANPEDRQAVLAMWDPTDEHYISEQESMGGDDLVGEWKDRPCNTHVYFRVNDGYLSSWVSCRSNDAIWGAHGANVVHFSYLHEYVANALGVKVGAMHQLSFNYHAYAAEFERVTAEGHDLYDDRYSGRPPSTTSIWSEPMGVQEQVDTDLPLLWRALAAINDGRVAAVPLSSKFARTVRWAALAHAAYKDGNFSNARGCVEEIEPPDWRAACGEWIERRVAAKEAK